MVRLSDFTGSPSKKPGKNAQALPDPGKNGNVRTGEPGRAAQIAPRIAQPGQGQEPGQIKAASEPPRFKSGSGSHSASPTRALVPVSELAARAGIHRSTIQDWADAGVLVGPRHESTDRRKSLCYTETEAAALIETMLTFYLIVQDGGKNRKTKLRPDSAFTSAVVDRFNEIWATESRAKQQNVQETFGDSEKYRAIKLDEVETWTSVDGSQEIRTAHPAEPEPVPYTQDIRQWQRGAPVQRRGHTRAARRTWGK